MTLSIIEYFRSLYSICTSVRYSIASFCHYSLPYKFILTNLNVSIRFHYYFFLFYYPD